MLFVVAEIFAHGACGIRRDVLQRSGLGGGRSHDDRVLHRARIGESLHNLRDGRSLLPDRAVNANHSLTLLVDDGVKNDRGFSRLAVANN